MKIQKALALTAALTIMLSAASCSNSNSDSDSESKRTKSTESLAQADTSNVDSESIDLENDLELADENGLIEVGSVNVKNVSNIFAVANDTIYTTANYKGFCTDDFSSRIKLSTYETYDTDTKKNVVLYSKNNGTAFELQNTDDVGMAVMNEQETVVMCVSKEKVVGYDVNTGEKKWEVGTVNEGDSFSFEKTDFYGNGNQYIVSYNTSSNGNKKDWFVIDSETGEKSNIPLFYGEYSNTLIQGKVWNGESLNTIYTTYTKPCGDKYKVGRYAVTDSSGNIIFSADIEGTDYVKKGDTPYLTALDNGYFALLCKSTSGEWTCQFFDNNFNPLTDRIDFSEEDFGKEFDDDFWDKNAFRNVVTCGDNTFYIVSSNSNSLIFDSDFNLYSGYTIDASCEYITNYTKNTTMSLETKNEVEVGVIGQSKSTKNTSNFDLYKLVQGGVVYVNSVDVDSTYNLDYKYGGALYNLDLTNELYKLKAEFSSFSTLADSDYVLVNEYTTEENGDIDNTFTLVKKSNGDATVLFDEAQSEYSAFNPVMTYNNVIWCQYKTGEKSIMAYNIDTGETSNIFDLGTAEYSVLYSNDLVDNPQKYIIVSEHDPEDYYRYVCTVYKFVDES